MDPEAAAGNHHPLSTLNGVRRFAKVLAVVTLASALLASSGSMSTAAPPPDDYTTPVWDQSFPDPYILQDGTTFRAYATSGPLGRIQQITSNDLGSWARVSHDTLGAVPEWATVGTGEDDGVWAPVVIRGSEGWVLFASLIERRSGKRCLMRAAATTAAGPFTDSENGPFLCDEARNGIIDPSVITAGGVTYLLWKTEGVPGREAPAVWSAPLNPALDDLAAVAVRLIKADQAWEYPLVENPAMIENAGRFYLLYSAREYKTANYAFGWGVCASPSGPCGKPLDSPLMQTDADLEAPGGAEWVRFSDGQAAPVVAFAARKPGEAARKLHIRDARFDDDRLVLSDKSGGFPPAERHRRIFGGDRFDTAARFAAVTVPPFTPVVYVATGAGFADALAASAAAGVEESPVLLVNKDSVPQSTAAQLDRLDPGHIVVMGGESVISRVVYDQLRSYATGADPIHREAGATRYETAAFTAKNVWRPDRRQTPVAYVATGEAFADALAAGAAGAHNGGPVLLVTRFSVPDATADAIRAIAPERLVVVGGTTAVDEAVVNDLRRLVANTVRIAGGTRYATAAQVALTQFRRPAGSVTVATGLGFADAVSAGASGEPLLLVPNGPVDQSLRDALNELRTAGVVVLGGPGVVSDETITSLQP